VRLVAKEVICFEIHAGPSAEPTLAAIRTVPDGFGGWQAVLTLMAPDGSRPQPVTRIFRSPDRAAAMGKMVLWVRRRFAGARPLPMRSGTGRPADRAALSRKALSSEDDREGHNGAKSEATCYR
jgi:hypothetical protein